MSIQLQSTFHRARVVVLHPAFLPLVFLVGAALPVLFYLVFPTVPTSDAGWYVARALELADGHGYQEGGWPTAYWPIGWPALLALGVWLTDSVTLGTLAINVTATLVSLYCVLWLGRRLTGEEGVGRLAVAMLAIYPGAVAMASVPLTEPSYTAVMLGAFSLLVAASGRIGPLMLVGALFGVATLIKPQSLLFPVGAIIALLLVYEQFTWRTALKSFVTIYIVLFAVVLPWTARNYMVFGEVVLVSTNGGTALLVGAHDRATGEHMSPQRTGFFEDSKITWEQRVEHQVELDKAQKAAAMTWIQQNPGRYFALMPKKLALLWRKDTYPFWGPLESNPDKVLPLRVLQAANQVYYVIVLALAAAAAVFALSALFRGDRRRAPLALLFCMPLFVSLLSMVFTGQIRYHYPAMPFLILASAWMLWHISAQFAMQPDMQSLQENPLLPRLNSADAP